MVCWKAILLPFNSTVFSDWTTAQLPTICQNNLNCLGQKNALTMSLKAVFNEIYSFIFFVLAPVNGRWGDWQPASWESTSCSGGYRRRYRKCDSPRPAHGGRDCGNVESSTESIDCNECEINNGECEHRCINYIGRYSCNCYPGYKVSQSDWKKCVGKYTMRIFPFSFLNYLSI